MSLPPSLSRHAGICLITNSSDFIIVEELLMTFWQASKRFLSRYAIDLQRRGGKGTVLGHSGRNKLSLLPPFFLICLFVPRSGSVTVCLLMAGGASVCFPGTPRIFAQTEPQVSSRGKKKEGGGKNGFGTASGQINLEANKSQETRSHCFQLFATDCHILQLAFSLFFSLDNGCVQKSVCGSYLFHFVFHS